jgi:ATP-dependent RNA helicase SUPV3L1/SUV3
LNIKRIVFHSALKKGDKSSGGARWIDPSNIKQIAGRAGRLSSKYKFGEVTAWQNADLAYIRAVMSWDVPQLTSIGLFPSEEQVEEFSEKVKSMEILATPRSNLESDATEKSDKLAETTPSPQKGTKVADVIRLSSLMATFVEVAQLDGRYFMCDHDDLITISNWLHTIPLTLSERFVFSNAPVNTRDPMSMNILYRFCTCYFPLVLRNE